MIPEELSEILKRQSYRLVGNHSAVKVCHWTKKSLLSGESCYKQKFYGIQSHRCLQMTPAVGWCQHSCLFCWRPVEHNLGTKMDGVDFDEPGDIVDKSIIAQQKLLSGYWGEKDRVDMERMKEACTPNNAALSLAGEPTTYPYLDGLIDEYNKRDFTTFLVTNGQNPDMLEKINPYQFYISMISPDEETYKRLNRPLLKDGWERYNRSLEIMGDMKGRTVARMTLVRGFNLENPESFIPLIEKARPKYIEAKGYVHVGYSRKRLEREDMPSYEEIKEFSEILCRETGYRIKDSALYSKVFLLERV